MNIWIVDSNLTSSHHLKEKLESIPFIESSNIKFFHEGSHFLKQLKSTTTVADKPEIIFVDVKLNDQDGIRMLLELIREDSSWLEKLCILTSISHGRIERAFKSSKVQMPPFILKNQIDRDLTIILENFLKVRTGNKEDNKEGKSKLRRKGSKSKEKNLIDLIKKIRSDYYEKGKGKQNLDIFFGPVKEIHECVTSLQMEEMGLKTSKLISMFRRKPRASLMKVRKELKGLMKMGEDVFKIE